MVLLKRLAEVGSTCLLFVVVVLVQHCCFVEQFECFFIESSGAGILAKGWSIFPYGFLNSNNIKIRVGGSDEMACSN